MFLICSALRINEEMPIYIYIYIYIYIFLLEKTKTGHIRIINLFPSCYGFLIKIQNTKKTNRTFSDLMDKKIFYQ